MLHSGLRALQVVLGLACLYALASSAGTVVWAALTSPEPPALPPVTGAAAAPRPIDHYWLIVDRDLFRAAGDAAPVRAPVDGDYLSETRLPLKLRGTSVANVPGRSLAVVENTRTRDTHVVRPGDRLAGARVEWIAADRVLIRRGDQRETIGFPRERTPDAGVAPAAPPVARATRARARTRAPRRLSRIDAQALRPLPRAAPDAPPAAPAEEDLDPQAATGSPEPAADARLQALSQQARFLPEFGEEGRLRGIAVTEIRPGSALERIGLRDGDIVLSIDGTAIEQADQVVPSLRGLDLSRGVAVEVERGGARTLLEAPPGTL